jgi:pimeloyl-ACP methyl ester carboxylesterase
VSAARAPAEPDLAGLALIAPPLALAGPGALGALAEVHVPLLVVAGSRDAYCPPDALAAVAEALPRAMVRTIDGADHSFGAHGRALADAVDAWAAAVLEARQARRRGGAG